MADVETVTHDDLNSLFAPTSQNGLESDILGVLESILRLYSITPQELFYKWESYCIKMGGGVGSDESDTKLDLNTARMFSKDVKNGLDRSNHSNKTTSRNSERKSHNVHATPKTGGTGSDVFGMLDDLTPNTIPKRHASAKRKSDFESPAARKVSRSGTAQKGGVGTPGAQSVSFADRSNPGQVMETLNDHLPKAEPPIAPFPESRLKPIANTDVKKFGYRPMSMRITNSSEILDERIDEFTTLIQKHHGLSDNAFGNAATQSTNEIVAVGRIASDTIEGKLNAASIVLETSRKMGAGLRVTLQIDALPHYEFFPGQIVAVRGTNASGMYFTVKEVLNLPELPMPVHSPASIEAINEKLGVSEGSRGTPLNILFASGPFTADDNLEFEPLEALCTKAIDEMADAMVLTGPFLDIEHSLIANGDFDLPDIKGVNDATMATLFRLWISSKLEKVCLAVPGVTIILVPSVRDAVSKHVSWPQEQIPKKELGLPKQVKMLPNPCFISLNETVIAISSQDILYELSKEQISQGSTTDLLTRLPRYVIEQRHFFPLYPPVSTEKLPHGTEAATGAMLDIGYMKLGEWLSVRPDVLMLPSLLTPSVKVVNSVMVINPGFLSKRKAAGCYSQMSLHPRVIGDEEREMQNVTHNVFDRARVDIVRI